MQWFLSGNGIKRKFRHDFIPLLQQRELNFYKSENNSNLIIEIDWKDLYFLLIM